MALPKTATLVEPAVLHLRDRITTSKSRLATGCKLVPSSCRSWLSEVGTLRTKETAVGDYELGFHTGYSWKLPRATGRVNAGATQGYPKI